MKNICGLYNGNIRSVDAIKGIEARQITGSLDASGLRFGVVVSRFNGELTDALARCVTEVLQQHGAPPETIDLVRVPGAYEIPVAAEKMAASKRYDALIALGVVIEGETQHAQMIIDTTGRSMLDIACRHRLPVINGIVGARSRVQAEVRCLGGENTRGWHAGLAAIEAAHAVRQVG